LPRRLLRKQKGFGAKRPDYRRKRIVKEKVVGSSNPNAQNDCRRSGSTITYGRVNYCRKYRNQRKFLKSMEASVFSITNNKEYSFARRLYYEVLPYFYLVLTDVNDNWRLRMVETVIRQSIDCYRNRIVSPYSYSPCATVHGKCVRAPGHCRDQVGPCVPKSATAELGISNIVTWICFQTQQ